MSRDWAKFYGYAKRVPLDLPEGGRTIVISDIHGNFPLFQGLLEKVNFTENDSLVLLGDLIEKGKYSLKTLRYIMELEKTHKVYPLCGNCDAYIMMFFETDKFDDFFRGVLRRPKARHSLLRQMGREAGLRDLKDLDNLRRTIRVTHKDIWDWLKGLPHIYDSQDYLFVHGGVPSLEENPQLLAWDCMKNDHFHSKGYRFPKYVVVGHSPTTLSSRTIQQANPLMDPDRHIISIDGGCVLKLDGQLNALLLENGEISWEYFDGLPQIRALEQQSPKDSSLNIRWGHSEVNILQRRGEFTLCRHLESGQELEILTSFLKRRHGTYTCEDATDYLLPVSPGDVFSLSQEVQGGVLGKKDGITGWYWGNYEKL